MKERGSRYIELSTCGGDDAGKAVASALHAKAHQRGWCACAAAARSTGAPGSAGTGHVAAARQLGKGERCARRRTRRARRRRGRPRRRAGARPLLPRRRRPLPKSNAPAAGAHRPDDDSDDSVLGFSPPRPPRPPATPASSIMARDDAARARPRPWTSRRPPPRTPGPQNAVLERHAELKRRSASATIVDGTRLSSPSPARAARRRSTSSSTARPHVQLRVAVRLRCSPRTVDEGAVDGRGLVPFSEHESKRVARWPGMPRRVSISSPTQATRERQGPARTMSLFA